MLIVDTGALVGRPRLPAIIDEAEPRRMSFRPIGVPVFITGPPQSVHVHDTRGPEARGGIIMRSGHAEVQGQGRRAGSAARRKLGQAVQDGGRTRMSGGGRRVTSPVTSVLPVDERSAVIGRECGTVWQGGAAGSVGERTTIERIARCTKNRWWSIQLMCLTYPRPGR